MKNKFILILCLCIIVPAQANYSMKYPLEITHGGTLPNGSIVIIPTPVVWTKIAPVYTNWVNTDELKDCTNWAPATSTMPYNEVFKQSATDCKQEQTRIRQDKEKNETTQEIRNMGSPITETQIIAIIGKRDALGTGPECSYQVQGTYWMIGTDNIYDTIYVRYNSSTIKDSTGRNTRQIIIGNKTYTKGVFVRNQDVHQVYKVCVQTN